MALHNLSYTEVIDLIANYYNTDAANITSLFAKYNVDTTNITETFKLLENTPYQFLYNNDGTVRSYTYNALRTKATSSASSIAGSIDSNIATKTADKVICKIPLNTAVEETTKKVTVKAGLKSAGNFALKSVVPAIAAVSAGITLGKTIDKVLYNANPDFWDAHGMQSIDPDTWSSITSDDDSLNATVFNMLFGITQEDNKTQAYMDERAFAYLALFMQNKGVFDEGGKTSDLNITHAMQPITYMKGNAYLVYYTNGQSSINRQSNYDFVTAFPNVASGSSYYYGIFASKTKGYTTYTHNNKTAYYIALGGSYTGHVVDSTEPQLTLTELGKKTNINKWNDIGMIAWTMLYGEGGSAIEGIGTQDGAKTPDLSGKTTIDDVLAALKEQYPELWEKAESQDVVQNDGSVRTYIYIPVGMGESTGDIDTQPTSGLATQSDTSITPSTSTQTLLDLIDDLIARIPTNTDINQEDATGNGNSPSIIIPTGSTKALWSIYNPTLTQVQSLGSFLWSTSFIDSILKMFNNPMEAVISLHKIFGNPPINGTGNIKIGYLDTGVSDVNLVSAQYFTIDCGSVDLPEYFGNVLDYNGYTNLSLYLPFVGIVNIDNADVMRSTISVKYQIDVFTGTCLVQVNVQRDASGGILYQYTGNCAVQYPLSSGSYMNIFTSALQGAVFGGLGGASGMVVGATLGAMRGGGAQYERSGNFSGNAGAMGVKKPYLIISRPQTQIADNAQTLIGYPTNTYTLISNCTGFTKILECHVDSIGNASDEEKRQIETALKQGIIVK